MPVARRLSVLAALALIASAAVPGVAAAADPGDTVVVTSCTEATFRAALDAARDGGTVAFGCDGTIPITPAAGGVITLSRSVTIDGTGHAVTFDGGGTTSLLYNLPGTTLVLRGVTLAHGGVGTAADAAYGGALTASGDLVVDRVVFDANTTVQHGGAIAVLAGTTTVTNSRFVGNAVDCNGQAASALGGAVWSGPRTSLTITRTSFVDNQARCSVGASGGAVFLAARNGSIAPYFQGLPLPANLPSPTPGQPVVIADSTFVHNVAASGFGDTFLPGNVTLTGGGAVTAFLRPLRVSGSTFDRNAAAIRGGTNGGAIFAAGYGNTTLDVTDSVFSANTYRDDTVPGAPAGGVGAVQARGGAIAVSQVTTTIARTTLTGNRALFGALAALASTVTVTDSRFADNVGGVGENGSATGPDDLPSAGAIYARTERAPVNTPARVTVTDSVLTGNTPVTCGMTFAASVELDGTTDDRPGTCAPPATPPTEPVAAGPLTTPDAPAAPGGRVILGGSGYVVGAAFRVLAYPVAGGAPTEVIPADGVFGGTFGGGIGGALLAPTTSGVYRVFVLGEAADRSGVRTLSGVLVVAGTGEAVAPVVTSAPADTTVVAGRTVSFTAAGAGSPAPAVRWQRSTDAGATWTDVAGAAQTTLTLPTQGLDDDGAQVRAVFTSDAGSVTSTPAALTVTPVPVTVTSAGTTIEPGAMVKPGQALEFALTDLPVGAVTVRSPDGTALGSATADAGGAATVAVTAPKVAGTTELVVRAAGVVVARVPLVVAAANPQPTAPGGTGVPHSPAGGDGGGVLATTGAGVAGLARTGLVLLLAGGAVVALGRRRRPGTR